MAWAFGLRLWGECRIQWGLDSGSGEDFILVFGGDRQMTFSGHESVFGVGELSSL